MRVNFDYFDKLSDSWPHNTLMYAFANYPPPIFVHDDKDISEARWIRFGFRNPEEAPDYTG